MANDDIPRPNVRFHARRTDFVTHVNGHLADSGLTVGDVVDLNNFVGTWMASTLDRPACAAQSIGFEASSSMLIHTKCRNKPLYGRQATKSGGFSALLAGVPTVCYTGRKLKFHALCGSV